MNPNLNAALRLAERLGVTVELVTSIQEEVEAYPGDVSFSPPNTLVIKLGGEGKRCVTEDAAAYHLFHELGHWLAASDEQRQELNFGDVPDEQEEVACNLESHMIHTLTESRLRSISSAPYEGFEENVFWGRRWLEEKGLLEVIHGVQ